MEACLFNIYQVTCVLQHSTYISEILCRFLFQCYMIVLMEIEYICICYIYIFGLNNSLGCWRKIKEMLFSLLSTRGCSAPFKHMEDLWRMQFILGKLPLQQQSSPKLHSSLKNKRISKQKVMVGINSKSLENRSLSVLHCININI